MRFFRETNINFLGYRNKAYIASLIVIAIGIISIVIKGIDYGIDFLGGTELIVQFKEPQSIGDIRSAISKAGFKTSEIKEFGDPRQILIRTEEQAEGTEIADRIKLALQQSFPQSYEQVLEEQKIGPKIGAELRRNAFYAVIFSLFAMLAYIGFRFKFVYGVGAVVALFHDVIVTFGIISIVDGLTPYTNFEIDQNMLAAFLTIVGLSVNDTVVIFDRIRENQKIYKAMSLGDLINKSVNQTLSRTVITSGTIFLVMIVIFIFGGEVNRGFAFALTVGIITGTYSSIYIASSFVYEITTRIKAKSTKLATLERKASYETVS